MDEPSQDFKPENQAVFVEAASIESKEQTIDKVDPDSENIAEVKLNEIQILGEDLREKNVEQDANVKDTKIVGKGNAESYHDFVDEKENDELNRRENVKTVNKSLAATIGEYEEVTNDDIDDLENVLEELEVFVEDGETKQVDYVVNVASKKANKFEVVKKTSSKIDRKIGKFFHRKSESQIVIKSTESSEKASKSAAPMSWLKKKLRSRSMSLGSLKRKSKKPEPLASSTDGVGDTNWFVVGAGAVEKSFDEATAKESDREAEVESRDVSETVESVDENLRHAGVVEDVSESKNVAREFVSQDVSKNVEKDFIHREVEDTENEESARTFTSRDVSETVVEDAIDFDSARRKPYEDLDGLEDVFDGADALGDVDARCESAELERILTRRPAGDEMSSSFGEVAIKRVKRRSSADIESLSKNAEVLSRRRSFSGSKTVSSVLSPDFVDISWKKGAEIVASKTTDENVIENAEIVANKITDENVIENAEIVASKITDENLIENAEIFASKTADGNSGVDVVEVKNAERVPRESAAGVEVEAFAVELKSSLETQPVVEESRLPSVRSPESTFPNVVAAEKTCNDFIASETRRNNENEVDRLEKHSESNVLLEGKITLSKHLETDDAEAGRNSKSADAQIEVVMAPIIEVTPEVGADRVIAKSTPQCSKSVGVTAHEVTFESKIGADRTQLNEIGVMSPAQLVEPAAEGAEFDSPEVIAPATLESSSTRYVEKEGERTAQSEVELVANFIEEDVTPKGSDLPETRFSDRMTHDTSRAGNLQEPGIEEPGIEEPGIEEPGFQEPGEQELGMQEPGKQKPGLEKPGLQELSVHGLTDIDRRPFDVRSADSNEKTESSTSDIRVEDQLNADRLNADRLNAISKNEMREFSEINDEFRNGLKSVDIGVDYELVAAAAAAVDVGDRDQSSNSSSSEEDTHIPGPDYDRYAEQRLAAKRAARAEAREIRMKEIEKQQKEEDAKEGSVPATGAGYEGKEHRPSAGSLRQLSTTSYSNSRRSSEDSIENDMAIHIRRRGMSNLQIQEAEEKYKKAMMNNAQLDNEKQLLKYQVDLLRDQIDDFEETITELNRQYRDKSSELEFQKRSYRELERNNEFLKEHIRQRDALIEEHGLVLIGTEGDTPVNNGATLLSHDTLQLLDKYGDGELDGSRPPKLIGADDKLRKLVDEKQSLDQEIRDLRKELDGYKAKEIVDEKYGTSSTKTNGPDIDVIQRETSRQISDYKFKLQKSEQEVSILEASVNRLESQVKRYKAAAEGAEKLEEELKTEKRRIARELREAQSTNEELQTQNSHLQKRLEKLKSSRNALLK
ncbi:uncharacterized protein LOC141911738 isoform X2 [Tubulanus polymorphus]|uniref:uncharacterized protein LOC141911738 isoform X2 n=1 Tax=Tubulanus polymorphus TaxID=672921 RepID=UPI003DA4612E